MSLINKMLKDLEKRDAFLNENSDHVLDGLYSAYDVELKKKSKSYTFLFISIFLISTFCFILFNFSFLQNNIIHFISEYIESDNNRDLINSELNENNNINAISSVEKQSDNVNDEQKSKSIDINLIDEPAYEKSISVEHLKLDENIILSDKLLKQNKVNRIESIYFEVNDAGINLIMKMPEEIDYLVYGLTNPERTVVEVKNAELGFKLEKLQPIEPIVAIRYSINEDNKFKLVLESESSLVIRKSVTSKSGEMNDLMVMMDYQWNKEINESEEITELDVIVDKQVEIEKEIVFKGDLVKTPVNKNPDEYTEKLFQDAYIAYKKGRTSESLKKLNVVLNHDPGHTKARATLALALSEKDHYELAYSVLNEGLIQYPENTEWLKVYARLLLNEGKEYEASKLLEKQKPELAYNTEYYALLAAVFQKLDNHNDAAKIYRDLLHVNPLKAVWWMGLGISLESLKRYDDALYAYQKASSNRTLANDTHQFILQRVNRITSLLKDESS